MSQNNTIYGEVDQVLQGKIENEFERLFGPNSMQKNDSLTNQTLSWTGQQLKKLQGFALHPVRSLNFYDDMA